MLADVARYEPNIIVLTHTYLYTGSCDISAIVKVVFYGRSGVLFSTHRVYSAGSKLKGEML